MAPPSIPAPWLNLGTLGRPLCGLGMSVCRGVWVSLGVNTVLAEGGAVFPQGRLVVGWVLSQP